MRDLGDETWEVLATTRGRPAPGERVVVGRGLVLVLQARGEGGRWVVRPLREDGDDRGASTFALLNSPAGLTFDKAGNLYVANVGNNTVTKVTPAGVTSTTLFFPELAMNRSPAESVASP